MGHGYGDYLDAGDNAIPSASQKMTKHWETCGTTNNSWGYNSYDDDWKSTRELLYWFIDIASKGGNYLLNIGPDGQGMFPKKAPDPCGKWGTGWPSTAKPSTEPLAGALCTKGRARPTSAARGIARRRDSRALSRRKIFGSTTNGKSVYAISLVPSRGHCPHPFLEFKSWQDKVGAAARQQPGDRVGTDQ